MNILCFDYYSKIDSHRPGIDAKAVLGLFGLSNPKNFPSLHWETFERTFRFCLELVVLETRISNNRNLIDIFNSPTFF